MGKPQPRATGDFGAGHGGVCRDGRAHGLEHRPGAGLPAQPGSAGQHLRAVHVRQRRRRGAARGVPQVRAAVADLPEPALRQQPGKHWPSQFLRLVRPELGPGRHGTVATVQGLHHRGRHSSSGPGALPTAGSPGAGQPPVRHRDGHYPDHPRPGWRAAPRQALAWPRSSTVAWQILAGLPGQRDRTGP
ncbi:hypothetical protein D3C85_1250960 [compost metagenome]